jgi:hypothetical protein
VKATGRRYALFLLLVSADIGPLRKILVQKHKAQSETSLYTSMDMCNLIYLKHCAPRLEIE